MKTSLPFSGKTRGQKENKNGRADEIKYICYTKDQKNETFRKERSNSL